MPLAPMPTTLRILPIIFNFLHYISAWLVGVSTVGPEHDCINMKQPVQNIFRRQNLLYSFQGPEGE